MDAREFRSVVQQLPGSHVRHGVMFDAAELLVALLEALSKAFGGTGPIEHAFGLQVRFRGATGGTYPEAA